MASQAQVKIDVGFNVNQQDLKAMLDSLKNVKTAAQQVSFDGTIEDFKIASEAAKKLEGILNKSWNSKLGQLDLSKFNNSIKESYGSLTNLRNSLSKIPQGSQAFNVLATQILNTNVQLKQSNKLLDEMAKSMGNTVRWGITSAIFNGITNSIQKAYNYSVKLDSSLNDIRIVTGKSADEMERFARVANTSAKNLGSSTLDYTKASLIYYQQGLSDEEAQARAETTLKAANVTGQSGEEVSEQLTAVWNGYKVTAEETEAYVDKLAAVAATTASDLEELSTGMSKVASAANSMGVDFDQLNAQMSTIISVTRQAPENVGTALKTIYARLGDLKADGTDEFGVSLGEVSSQLATMGIQILDQQGNIREMGDVIEEVAGKWDTWTEAQRQAAAVAMAGKRQYNNLIALFDNWDMYTKSLETSTDAIGTLQKQQDIYMESTEAHLQKLKAESEKTYDVLFDTDTINTFADTLTGVLSIFNNFIDGLGGGVPVFLAFGTALANIFSNQIGNYVGNFIHNIEIAKTQAEDLIVKQKVIDELQKNGKNVKDNTGSSSAEKAATKTAEYMQTTLILSKSLTEEEQNQVLTLQKSISEREYEIEEIKAYSTYLEKINVDEKTSVDLLKIELKEQKALVQSMKDEATALEMALVKKQQGIEWTEKEKEVYYELGGREEDRLLSEEELIKKFDKQTDELQNQVSIERNLEEGLKRKIQFESEDYQIKLAQQEAEEKILKQIQAEAAARQNISEITRGFSAMVGIITTVGGAIKNLTDSSKGAEEKIKSLFTMALMSAPMIIKYIGDLKTGFIALNAQMLFSTGAMEGLTLAEIKTEIATKGLSVVFQEAGTSAMAMWAEILGPIAPIILAIGAVVAALAAVGYIAYKNEHAAQEAADSARKNLALVQEALQKTKQEAEDLKQTISSYSDACKSLEELEKNTDEYREALAKANEEAKKLLEAHEAWDASAYEFTDGLIVIKPEKLKEWQEEADTAAIKADVNSHAAEMRSIKADQDLYMKDNWTTTIEYEDMPKAIAEAANKIREETGQLDAPLASLRDQLKTSALIPKEFREHIDEIFNDPEYLKALEELSQRLQNDADKLEYHAKQVALDSTKLAYEDKIREHATTKNEKGEDVVDEGLTATLENITATAVGNAKIANGQTLEEAYTNIDVSNVKSNADLRQYEEYADISNDEDLAKEYAHKILGVAEDAVLEYKGGINKGSITDKSNANNQKTVFENVSDDEMRAALAEFAERERIQQEIVENLQSEDNIAEQVLNATDKIRENGKNISDNIEADFTKPILDAINNGTIDKIDLSSMFGEMSPEDVDKLVKLEPDQLAAKLGLTSEDFKILGFENSETFSKAFQAGLEDYDPMAWIETQLTKTQEKSSTATSVIDSLMGGKELTKEQIEALEKLEDEYTELGAIQDKTSKAYLNKLIEIREALEQQEIKLKSQKEALLTKEANDKLNKINIEVNEEGVEELQDTLKEICEADYEVLVSVKTDIQSDFDTDVKAMEDLESMASKIGDDFKVSAKDIEELNDVFPGILEGMDILKDGSVQLNEEMVKSAMEAAEAEVAANNDKTIQNLKGQMEELAAKRDAARAIARIAADNAKTEGNIEKNKADLKTQLDVLNQKNSELTSEKEQDDAIDVAETAATTSESMAKNYGGAYEAMSKDAIKWAGIAHQALLSSQDPNVDPPTEDGVGGFAGASFSSTVDVDKALSNKGGIESADDAVEDWKEVEEYYNNLADSYDEALNNVMGKIGELTARGKGIGKEFDNISKGLGSDGEKKEEKSKKEKERSEKEGKKLDEEFDRYWEIKKAIDAVDTALNKLSKDQEHLYGDELADSLMKTNELLEQQAANYARLAEEQRKEAAELQNVLGGMGVTFDASGAITNYAAATTAALAQYNEAIAKYNAGLIDEASLKVYETQYELFKKQLERYDQLFYSEMKQTQEKLEEIERQKKANNLKAWKVKLEVKLEMKELKREWNNFLNEINSDFKSVYKDLRVDVETMKKNAKTYGGKNGTINTEIKSIKEVEKEIDKMKSGGTSSKYQSISEAQEDLKELNDKLMNDAKAFHDLVVQAWQAYLDGIDQVKDQLDELFSRYQRISDKLSYLNQLSQIVYGDNSTKGLKNSIEYYNQAIKVNDELMKSQKATIETLQKDFNKLLEKNGLNMRDREKWTEDVKKEYEMILEYEDAYNDKVLENAQLNKDRLQANVQLIKQQYLKSILGENYEIEDKFRELEKLAKGDALNEVVSLAEYQKLENSMDDLMNDLTSNAYGQNQLLELRNSLQDELNEKLKEQGHLDQYDIDRANLRLQILQKELEIESAKENKTSMKVVRNEEGNWSYQYAADENEINTLKNDLLDLEIQLNNLDEKRKEALEEQRRNTAESVADIYETLVMAEANGEITHEQMLAYMTEANTLSKDTLLGITDLWLEADQNAMESSIGLAAEVADQNLEMMDNASDEVKQIIDDVKQYSATTYQEVTSLFSGEAEKRGLISKENSELLQKHEQELRDAQETASEKATRKVIEDTEKIESAHKEATEGMIGAAEEYSAEVQRLSEQAGVDISNIGEAMQEVGQETEDLDGKAEQLANNGVDYINDLRDAAEELEEAWNKVKDAIEDAIAELERYLQMRGQAGSGGTDGLAPSSGSGSGSALSGSGGGGKSGDGSSSNSSSEKDSGELFYKVLAKSSVGKGYTWDTTSKKEIEDWIGSHPTYHGYVRIFYKKKDGSTVPGETYKNFDTGGYTGSWPGADAEENGRLAMLHQKELVLNADDTQNLLNAVGIVRALGDFIAATTAGLGNISAPGVMSSISNNNNSSTYGDVVINASFPNANDVNAIKEAILNLPNMAAQYFSQNRK